MKNIIGGILFFSSQWLFSQTYHFDYLINENLLDLSTNKVQSLTHFYDSKSEIDLPLSVGKNNQLVGFFQDKNAKLTHFFLVDDTNQKLKFTYQYSFKSGSTSWVDVKSKNDDIVIKPIGPLVFEVLVYDSPKRKTYKLKLLLTLEQAERDYLVLNSHYTKNHEIVKKLKTHLDSKLHYKIIDQKYTNRIENKSPENYDFEKKIISISDVNLDVKLPEKLNYKESFF